MSVELDVRDVTVAWNGTAVLEAVALSLPAGSHGVVLGPSGAGKSTLLKAIAGLVPARGHIRIGGRVVCAGEQVVPPEERGLGFLFQGLALWPHMTGDGHLRYALKGSGVPRSEHEERIRGTLEPLGLLGLRDRRPGELSGGERQRLALARALVTRPGLLLLDEPTSSVDPRLQRDVRALLADVKRRFGSTILHVTHDQEEALELADRIFVMQKGRILQGGTPEDVYERPVNREVGTFVGDGGVLPATLGEDGIAQTPLGSVRVAAGGLVGPVWVLFRPEDLAPAGPAEGIEVTVERVAYRGGSFRVRVRIGDDPLLVDLPDRPAAGELLRIKVVRPPRIVEARRSS